ncbi:MAG: hypothetical protein LBT33_07470 [Spirochaetia bacterium]|jgi:hypothetical protein|nr:hypothetical protein [Spirochaetia bacterium]
MAKRIFGLVGLLFLFLPAAPAPWAQEDARPPADAADPAPGGEEAPAAGDGEDASGAEAPPEAEAPVDPLLYNTIVHAMSGDVIFMVDPQARAAVGDMYEIIRDGRDIGLLVVSDTQESIAVARIVFSDEVPQPGDGVREAGRAGIEATFYGGSFLKDNFSKTYMPLGGIRLVLARWFYYTRPALEIGTLLARAHPDLGVADTFPFNALAGAEITNLYMGRFQLGFVALAGLGWSYLNEEAAGVFDVGSGTRLRHVNGKMFVSLSCLLASHVRITADAGILAMIDRWQTFSEINDAGYFGRKVAPFLTFGLTLR